MTAEFNKLSERFLKLELQLEFRKEQHTREREHWQERQAAEREHFRLQLENLILRAQRGLPPLELSLSPAESVQQPDQQTPNKPEE